MSFFPKVSRAAAVVFLSVSLSFPLVRGESLTIVTWNAETLKQEVDFSGFVRFAKTADVIVLQEILSQGDLQRAMRAAGIADWHLAVSDFSKDTDSRPYMKLEVAVLSPHRIFGVIEVDPYPNDDTPEMRQLDVDLVVPSFLPEDQRTRRGSRGWLWVQIPQLKLAVAAVHLKSSTGRVGASDEENSFKREAVTAGLAVAIRDHQLKHRGWSYVVAGDFNVSPGDGAKVGVDLRGRFADGIKRGYDQTHTLLRGGIVEGILMRNLTVGLTSSYAKGKFAPSPIDNIYVQGPLFDETELLVAKRGDTFGSDHHAIMVSVE